MIGAVHILFVLWFLLMLTGILFTHKKAEYTGLLTIAQREQMVLAMIQSFLYRQKIKQWQSYQKKRKILFHIVQMHLGQCLNGLKKHCYNIL